MVISKNTRTEAYIYINRIRIERVKSINNFDTIINERWDHTQEIKCHKKKRKQHLTK